MRHLGRLPSSGLPRRVPPLIPTPAQSRAQPAGSALGLLRGLGWARCPKEGSLQPAHSALETLAGGWAAGPWAGEQKASVPRQLPADLTGGNSAASELLGGGPWKSLLTPNSRRV